MARLMLRKGFTLQPGPGGMGHLTDSRTGDVLVLPPGDYALLSSGADGGLDTERGDLSEVLNRYRPFYVDYVPPASFYELDIEDAPTVPQIPSIAPVAIAPPQEPAPQQPAPSDEGETKDDVPLAELMPLPEAEDLTQPEGRLSVSPPSPEEQLGAAQETQRTEEVKQPEAARLSAPAPAPAEPTPSSKPSPLLLAFAAVLILALGVGATFLLRPELFSEQPSQQNPTTVVPPKPEPVPEPILDAGAEAEVDAGAEELDAGTEGIDAGADFDAGAPLVAAGASIVDAGDSVEAAGQPSPQPSPPRGEGEGGWLTSEVQARGRVKMGEVVAGASGVVTWSVQEEERVKSKQPLGSIARENGAESTLTSPSVGLAMLKQPSGSTVKRGEVLADIIYFEAWAKGLVKGGKPTTAWRCEIVSASANQRADCKISVITPKSGGAQLMVAVEPRWFDDAADAVLRVAPP